MSIPSFLKPVEAQESIEDIPSFLKPVEYNQTKKRKPKTFVESFKEELFSPEESAFEKGTMTALRGIGSRAAGTPGDLYNMFRNVGHGIGDMMLSMFDIQSERLPESFLPGTEQIEKGFDIATDKQYQPTEEMMPVYETMQDITSMLMPGSTGLSVFKKIAIPIAGQFTKQGIKAFGGDETSQELGKFGSMLALSLAGIGNAPKYVENLMSQSESVVKPGSLMEVKPIGVSNLKSQPWYKGVDTPSTRPAKQLIEAIEKNTQNGQIPVEMAIELRKQANELSKNLGAFDIKTKPDKKKAISLINEVKNKLIKGLDYYGETQDPVFGQLNREANKAYATVAKSQVIKNFLEKYIPKSPSNALKYLFYGSQLGGSMYTPGLAPTIGGVGLGASAALRSGQILYRVLKDPKLAKYYGNVILNAAKQNGPATASNMKKLDKAIKED